MAHFSYSNGADVIQGNCSGGRNQQWRFAGTDSGYHEVIARHSAMCLSAYRTDHGAPVRQYSCAGSSAQQWIFVATDSGYFRLVNRSSNRCLDVAHLSIAHGAKVIIGDCWSPGHNQQWKPVFRATANR